MEQQAVGDALGAAIAATDGVVLEPAAAPAQRDSVSSGRHGSGILGGFRWSMRTRRSVNPSEEEYVAPTEELIYLEVRPAIFAVVWWIMVVIHAVCATLLTIQTRLYLYLTNPYMKYYTNLIRPGIVDKFTTIAAVFGVIATMHWSMAFRLVYYSICQRKYAFYPSNHYENTHGNKPVAVTKPRTRWQRFTARLSACRLALFGRRGVFGVESRYFYPYFYVREAIELSSQIYQAYRGSLLVGRPWINHLSIAIIVTNCLLTPVIQLAYKRRPEVRRIAMLSLDAVLDFMTAMVVPISIFYPYYLQFDATRQAFPEDKVYDEKWFINAVLENQEFFIVSVADFIFKCIPHISITSCLKKVRALLRKDTSIVRSSDHRRVFTSVVAPSIRREREREKLQRVTQRAELKKALAVSASTVRTPAQAAMHAATATASKYVRKYANKLVRCVFFAIAGIILGIHLQAVHTSYRATTIGCEQVMRPWFSSSFACSVVEVSCKKQNITGTADEIASVLAHVFPSAVAALVISHCPSLEMPPALQSYKHLLRLDIYNSTLVRWDADAALEDQFHPLLASVSLARVTLVNGELPAGLMSMAFPTALRSVEISVSNLATLPADLHTRWRHAMTRVYIEHASLRTMPATLVAMEVEKLSLHGNAIASLDAAWLTSASHAYFIVDLANNPLTALPPAVDPAASLRYLHLQHTQISTLPAWVAHESERVRGLTHVFAYDTPFCAGLPDAAATHSAAALVSCAAVNNDTMVTGGDSGQFPLRVIDAARALSDAS